MGYFTGYIGTYHTAHSYGIYRFSLDTRNGGLSAPEPFLPVHGSKYLALREDGLLASIVQHEQGAGLFLTKLQDGTHEQNELLPETGAGCHVALSATHAYTANFHSGMVCCYRLADTVPVLEHTISIAPKAGCHQVLLHDDLLLVPCMELDEICLFSAKDYAPQGAIAFPAGSGPRHGVFGRTHQNLYVAAEKENTVYCFGVHAGAFEPEQRVPLLDSSSSGCNETAAIRFSPDERFLYVSVRGANRIVVLACTADGLQVIQRVSCGGDHPRDIALSPDGRFVLSVNRYSGDLTCFPRDPASGRIGEQCSKVSVPEGVSIVFDAQMKGEENETV